MEFPASYDITRLGSRMFNSSPNGIHRVDAALARYFLSIRFLQRWNLVSSISEASRRQPKPRSRSSTASTRIWAKRLDPELEPIYTAIKDWVLRDAPGPASVPIRVCRRPRVPLGRALGWTNSPRTRPGSDRRSKLAQGRAYLNASQFGLAIPGAFDWLASRPDVKAVFFIHDMLPFETPEYFLAKEFARHQNRMHNLARHGAGADRFDRNREGRAAGSSAFDWVGAICPS